MSTTLTAPEPKANGNGNAVAKPNQAQAFRQNVGNMAASILRDWVGEERARNAIARVQAAFAASAAAAKDPTDFYSCTPQSVAMCIAISALTEIWPGVGPTALAYVLPRRPRKDEPPQLQYQLSHRGVNAIAQRCGQFMFATPISIRDEVTIDATGNVIINSIDMDNPPTKFDELRGVSLSVRNLSTGVTIVHGWVPKKLIEARRAVSQSAKSSFSPWSNWPIEMSIKTAMHYAIGRGWCVIDDTNAQRALTVDVESDLPSLPAPTGPSSVGELANMISHQMVNSEGTAPQSETDESAAAGTIDELEPVSGSGEAENTAGDQQPGIDSTPYLIGEKEPSKKYTDRLVKAIREAQSLDTLDAINAGALKCQAKVKPEEWQAIDNALESRGQQLLQAQDSGSLIS